MAAQLMWILVVYASAVVIVHLLHIREKTQQSLRIGKWLHYILIIRNHESVIEWYIRMLTLHTFLTGKRLRVTCMDDGSTDATLFVVSKLIQSGCSVDVKDLEQYENRNLSPDGDSELQQDGRIFAEKEIVIDLRAAELLIPLPFLPGMGSRGYRSKHGE